ncbi:MAG: two-component sensor histidine kinase, partial [Mycobacterium sp.]|nr:two-component sensor histidine kinase [Mycobacterium sp.]
MSSSPRADAGPSRFRSPRSWSLRARLLASQIVLLALVCAAIGAGTEFALQRFLMNQLDDRVAETGRRSTGLFEFGPPPPPPGMDPMMPDFPGPPGYPRRVIIRDDHGPGPAFFNAPGQAARTVGAVISHGTPVDGGVITADGTRAQISPTAAQQLAHIQPNHRPQTVELDGLGRYRVIATHARGPGETIVTGLPTSDVDDTLLQVLVVFGVVGAIALIGGTTAGIIIIRRQLAPLSSVSEAARQVADLELDRGEVRLPTPIVKVDPAGADTEIGQLGSA